MILDSDDDPGAKGQAEGASGEVDAGCMDLDVSLHNTFATSELTSAPIEPIDASGPWVMKLRRAAILRSQSRDSVLRAAQRAFCPGTSTNPTLDPPPILLATAILDLLARC